MLCRLIGHRLRFSAAGDTMSWECRRGCGEHGSKQYSSPEAAARYARGLNREDHADLGRRAPLVALLPLRLLRAIRGRPAPKEPPSHG